MKKLGLVLATSLLVLTGCGNGSGTATPGNEEKNKTLTVLTSSGYPPYETRTTEGELVGFDVELTEMIAENLGYTVKWEDMDFNALIGAVNAGKGDMVAAGLSPTKERKQGADLSDSYYTSNEETANFVLTLKDGDIKETKDIKGKKAGIQIGTIQEAAVNAIQEEYELKTDPRNSYGDMVQEIKNKRIDFIVVEKAVAQKHVETNPELSYFQLEAEGNSTGNVFAFKKGNTELCEEVNGEIKKLQESGELDKLIEKWFAAEAE